MIQDQSIQSQQQAHCEQVQVINTSDQPVCITGLNNYWQNSNSISNQPPIIIQRMIQPSKPINSKIILITSSPQTASVSPSIIRPRQQIYKAYSSRSSIKRPLPAQTRIIQVPFLPRSPSKTPVMKQSWSIEDGSVKTAYQEAHSNIASQIKHLSQTPTQTVNILIDEDLNSCSSPCSNRSEIIEEFQTHSEKEITSSQQQTQQQQSTKTLASMAGIQLTGSVESLPAAMSGAMPTATVEEINVPVFINEYLQQSAFLTSNSNGDDHSKQNNNKCKTSFEEDSIENCIDSDDIFENFEFDIGLITTDDNTDSETNINIEAEEEEEEALAEALAEAEEQQKEIMLSNDYFYNICNNNNNNYNKKNIEDFSIMNFQSMNCNDTTTGAAAAAAAAVTGAAVVIVNDIKKEQNGDDWNDDDCSGHPAFISMRESEDMLLTEDDIADECNSLSIHCFTENAIDITTLPMGSDCISLSDIMLSSQNNPMFSATAINNSQTAVLNAEPIVPDINSNDLYDGMKMEEINFDSSIDCGYESLRSDCGGAVKRKNTTVKSRQDNDEAIDNIRQKRRKLHLETTFSNHNENAVDDLNTPGVVELIDQMGSDKQFGSMHYKNTKDIISELLNYSNSSYQSASAESHTPFTVISFDDNDDQPNTPLSCISSSYSTNQTNNNITSPSSPALSTISTSTTVANSSRKSRRGRPPKLHSDLPDPSELENLTETERKRRQDRAKNNEASRLSRLKNKQREEEKIQEEIILTERNQNLMEKYNRLCREEQKLKCALERRLRLNK